MNSHFVLLVALLLICNAASLPSEGIISGDEAHPDQFPYQVSLQWGGGHICGGALVAADMVLTAGHCVYFNRTVPPRQYDVVAGSIDLMSDHGQKLSVTKIYAHKDYRRVSDNGLILNDIALLRLAQKFVLSSSINTVSLPKPGGTFARAVISGYGWDQVTVHRHDEYGSSEEKLKYATVRVMPSNRCEAKDFPTILCANAKQISSTMPAGVCSGDSGSPLVFQSKVIIGIVSSSPTGCDESRKPAHYTEVSNYIDFIQGAIDDNPTADTLAVEVSYLNDYYKYENVDFDFSG